MYKILALKQIFGDAVVVHQPARGFPQGRVFQQRVSAVAGVECQVILLGGGNAQHVNAGFPLQGGYLIGAEIAGDIGITLLNQQAARGRIGDVFNNDTFQLRCAGRRAVVGLQHDGLMRLIDAHFERAAARRVHFQPAVTEIVVFNVRRHQLLIHDGGDRRGEDIQRHRRADVSGPVQLQRMVIDLFQLAGDVVRLPAEDVEDKRGGLIQRHRAGVGENNIFRAQRIARGESGIGLQLDGQRFRRRVSLPAFGQNRGDFFRVIAIGLNQALIEARYRLNAGKLIGFCRVEADDVVETLGNDQGGGRCRSMDGGGECGQHQ